MLGSDSIRCFGLVFSQTDICQVILQLYCYFSLFQRKAQNYATQIFFSAGVCLSLLAVRLQNRLLLFLVSLFSGIWGQLWALCVTDLPEGALYLCPFSRSSNSAVPSFSCESLGCFGFGWVGVFFVIRCFFFLAASGTDSSDTVVFNL